mmetsp:Transcript_20324/g.48348  ORF Transcript_20324/g.48348 Transcript_20324/m.48348 type:complete len:103 (+) Transcript_20324:772-1080(+)
MIWGPEASGKAWNATKSNNTENTAFRILIQSQGWFLVSYSVLIMSLVLGVGDADADEAAATAPIMLLCLDGHVYLDVKFTKTRQARCTSIPPDRFAPSPRCS